jgi:hypothetical protein
MKEGVASVDQEGSSFFLGVTLQEAEFWSVQSQSDATTLHYVQALTSARLVITFKGSVRLAV